MEDALRQGQAIALTASAQAVAARIASEASLRKVLSSPENATAPEFQVYLHPFSGAIIVDGYDDDWRDLNLSEQYLNSKQSHVSVAYRAGVYKTYAYLLVSVTDPVVNYHNPSHARIASGDHLILRLGSKPKRAYVIRTSAPGNVTARYANRSGHIRQEHFIRGIWREKSDGYQVELQLPLSLLGGELGLVVVNRDDDNSEPEKLGTLMGDGAQGAPAPFVSPHQALVEAIGIFSGEGLRLRVASLNQWLVAQSGQLTTPASPEQQHGLLSWLNRSALGARHFPILDQPARSGRLNTKEVQLALQGVKGARWYQDGVRRVGRAAVPIYYDKQIFGAVVAEQSTDAMLALTNTAFNRLFFYTLLTTGIAGIGLLSYASWLSLRIRRLSRAADTAIGDDGKIQGDFPSTRAKDEVGDLTRSYGQLLARLKEYTEYLKSLSSKLSHELRTPLAVVRSSLDNLEYEPLPKSALTYIDRAKEGVSRLSGILSAMSAATRVEQSIKGAEIETFRLDTLVENLGAAYADVYPDTNIVWAVEPANHVYEMQGAPELIVQMLDKLIDNAVDFCSKDGSVQLTLSRHDKQLHLQVSNDGPLLPQQMQGQLFDSLVSIRDKNDGSAHLGLGLHIVQMIVAFHDGKVSAQNRSDGSGVVFDMSL